MYLDKLTRPELTANINPKSLKNVNINPREH